MLNHKCLLLLFKYILKNDIALMYKVKQNMIFVLLNIFINFKMYKFESYHKSRLDLLIYEYLMV